MTLLQLLFLLTIHWFSDFVMQFDEDAKNKWHSVNHLSNHIIDYGKYFGLAIILAHTLLFTHFICAVTFVAINILLHFVTDFFTSKWTHNLWEKKDVHNFFVVVGLDQLIHYICIFSTYYLLK